MITFGSLFLTIGTLPMILLLVTLVGILGIVLHRTIWCRFWRSDEADRRREQCDFDGSERRRRHRRGSASDRK